MPDEPNIQDDPTPARKEGGPIPQGGSPKPPDPKVRDGDRDGQGQRAPQE